jgi:hypothetical protein
MQARNKFHVRLVFLVGLPIVVSVCAAQYSPDPLLSQFDSRRTGPPAELAAEIVESLEAAVEQFRGVEEALLTPTTK